METRKNPAAVALGRKGGQRGGAARAESLTPEQRSAIARMGSAAVGRGKGGMFKRKAAPKKHRHRWVRDVVLSFEYCANCTVTRPKREKQLVRDARRAAGGAR